MAQNFYQARLLVIEDNDDVWQISRIALQRALPEVELDRVSNHQQAVSYLVKCLNDGVALPKLILQDLYIPKRADGLQLLNDLRRHLTEGAYPQLPIIVVSSSTEADDVQLCYQHGASSYMVKTTNVKEQIENYKALRKY